MSEKIAIYLGRSKALSFRVTLSEGLKAKIRWQAVVEVLRRRSKTEERSDEGVHERTPIAFLRKPTSLEKRIAKIVRRSRHATHAALPWVGFDYENAALWRFLRSG